MLKQVLPYDLTDQQIRYYHEAIKTDDHSGGLLLVERGIYEDHLGLWVWNDGDSEMVIVTQVIVRPDGYRELLVLMLAGTGGCAKWEDVTKEFADEVAPALYCDRVIAMVKPWLWEKFKAAGAGSGCEEVYVVIGRYPSESEQSKGGRESGRSEGASG